MDVGLNLKMTDSGVSAVASKVVTSVHNMADAAKELNQSLQLGDLQQQYESFANRIDALRDAQLAAQQQRGGGAPGGGGAGGGRGGGGQAAAQPLVGGLRATGGYVQTLGRSGDVAGVGIDALGQVGEIAKGAGPVGAVIAAVAALAFVGNALSVQYEKAIPTLIEFTGAMGDLTDTTENYSDIFKTRMQEVSDVAADFGYSLEEGTKFFQTLASLGAQGNLTPDVQQMMLFARGTGASEEALLKYLGTGRRFGMQGNLLGMGAGAAVQSGMGEARIEEFLNATLSIFEDGLTRGVVKGFDEISRTQVWLGQLGEIFKGQAGVNLYRQMERSVSGATELSAETDAIMFRSAKRLLEEQTGTGVGYVAVMKELEKGITADLYDQIMKSVTTMTGSETDKVEMMRQLFGVNYTTASQLLQLQPGGVGAIDILTPADVRETPEMRLMKSQLEIMEYIREMGSTLIDAKMFVLEGAETVVRGIAELSGGGGNVGNVEQAKMEEQQASQTRSTTRNVLSRILREQGGSEESRKAFENITKVIEDVTSTPFTGEGLAPATEKYGEENIAAAPKLRKLLAGLSKEDIQKLAGADVLQQLSDVAMQKRGGEWFNEVSGHDMAAVLSQLTTVLERLDVTVGNEKNIDVLIEE